MAMRPSDLGKPDGLGGGMRFLAEVLFRKSRAKAAVLWVFFSQQLHGLCGDLPGLSPRDQCSRKERGRLACSSALGKFAVTSVLAVDFGSKRKKQVSSWRWSNHPIFFCKA